MNDLAIDLKGNVYVTDSGFVSPGGNDMKNSGTDAVWKLDTAGKLTKLAFGSWLGNPNGIVALPNGDLWVASYDINQSDPGQVLVLDANGKKKDTITFQHGLIDGLAAVGGAVIASSQVDKGAVYGKLLPDGTVHMILPGKIIADLAYDDGNHSLLLPAYYDNQLIIQPYTPAH